MNKVKIGVDILSVYKILMNLARITIGIAIFIFSCSYSKFIWFLIEHNLVPDNHLVNNVLRCIEFPSHRLAYFLALCLIVFSLIELVFIVSLLLRKKWGAVGMFILAIVWTFVEILFVSKFLVTSKLIATAINIVIMYFLYRLLTNPQGYFKAK